MPPFFYQGYTGVVNITRTGGVGAPGTETYLWDNIVSPPSTSIAFNNPTNASSQSFSTFASAPFNGSVRITVTDSGGNASSKNVVVTQT